MSLLVWKPEYAVGVASVDYEHQQMIRLINEIYDEMKSRRDAASLEQFLGDVHFAISAHFALEERLMRDAAYSEYEAHKEDHENLLDQLRELMDELVSDPETGIDALKDSLSDWFEYHFATFDARLHGKLDNG
ncbi:MAG: bacteriohemerythrin [Woeseiaceae bacterium]|nr:bacteriohemerythrin [Woeseiaceae bacterium]